jgi:hypothetical protein
MTQAQGEKGVYYAVNRKGGMKRKIPLLGLWLISDRRLRAGQHHRFELGYQEGFVAGSAGLGRDDTPSVTAHAQETESIRHHAPDLRLAPPRGPAA